MAGGPDMDRYAFRASVTGVSPVGLTPSGVRLDAQFAGRITEGPLTGCTIEGIDYLLIRPDGVGVIDARALVSDGNRVIAAVRAAGYVFPPSLVPDLAVLADPAFQWPDEDLPLHGAHFWELADGGLSRAASTVYSFNGTLNVATGALEVSGHSLAVADRAMSVD